jgi:hypothetical protein
MTIRRDAVEPAGDMRGRSLTTVAGGGRRVVLASTLTCPACGAVSVAVMPADACQWFYVCAACGATLTPLPGDCCVFCSYGDVPCPPVQAALDAGQAAACRG